MIDVAVIKSFSHEGREIAPGDTLRVTPVEAAALHRRGVITLTRGYRTAALEPDPPPADPPKRRPRKKDDDHTDDTPRRRYRRRDMTPEA